MLKELARTEPEDRNPAGRAGLETSSADETKFQSISEQARSRGYWPSRPLRPLDEQHLLEDHADGFRSGDCRAGVTLVGAYPGVEGGQLVGLETDHHRGADTRSGAPP